MREVVAFAGLACLPAWAYWLVVIASERGWIPIRVPLTPLGAFSPLVAALAISSYREGRPGMRRLVASRLRWRVGLGWYALALLAMPTIVLGSLLIARLRGPLPPFAGTPWAVLPLAFLEILLLGGPLGEEPGWRGYALPRLLDRCPPITATLVVWAIWLSWHVPLFWVAGSAQAQIPFGFFAMTLLAYAVLFTWIRSGSGGLPPCVLLHAGINTAYWLVGAAFPGIWEVAAFGYGYVGLNLAAAAAVVLGSQGFRRQRSV